MNVTVAPAAFSLVDFDAGRIAALAAAVATLVGVPDDVAVEVEVDERSPFGKTSAVVSGRSVRLLMEGGALEDPQRLRQFSEPGARLALGRLLYRVADRFDPAFGDPPPDADLTMAEHAAWDAYCLGRYARRAGVDGGHGRRRYAFRIRHGFTDAADQAFDQLWNGLNLTWSDIRRVSAV